MCDNFLVIVTRLVIFPGQERTPGNRSPRFVAFAVQIVYLEETFQCLAVILELQMAMSDTDLDGEVVGRHRLVAAIIFQRLFRLLERTVATRNPARQPLAAGLQQVCMQISFQCPLEVVGHLFAVTDFLEKGRIVRVCFCQAVEDGQGIVEVVLAQVIFSNRRQTLFVRDVGTQRLKIVEVQRQGENVRKIQMARIELEEAVQVLYVLPGNDFGFTVFMDDFFFLLLNHRRRFGVKLRHHHFACLFGQLHHAEIERKFVGIAHESGERHRL